jgi:hypothetical protein
MSEWENLKKEWDKEDKKEEKGFGEEWVKTITHCLPRCPRCQGALQTVNVGGHEQCVLCHSVIDDCCQGAPL